MEADRIIVPEKGKIVEQDTHHELIENKGLYFALWRQQIGERVSMPHPVSPKQGLYSTDN